MKNSTPTASFATLEAATTHLAKLIIVAALLLLATRAAGQPLTNQYKWNQPPVPAQPTNYYYGWNELSITNEPFHLVGADDWVCSSTNPVTKIRWWGSFLNWVSNTPPPVVPNSFQITIWTDVATNAGNPFSHPGMAIWQTHCANFKTPVFVGWDYDPRTGNYEACFLFEQDLLPHEYFYQPEPTGTIYWLSVAAEYWQGTAGPHPWGWKTRPRDVASPAPDAAVRIFQTQPWPIVPGSQYLGGAPIFWPTPGNAWDLAFELISNYGEPVAKWEQLPDVLPTGIDINATFDPPPPNPFLLADDFLCTATGPVTNITVWGSWRYDELPGSPSNLTFTLSFHTDVPANQPPWLQPFSAPGTNLWVQTFTPQQYSCSLYASNLHEGWMDPPAAYTPNADWTCFQYDFPVVNQPFVQTGSVAKPTIYWLDVQAHMPMSPQPLWKFGWKTSVTNWNDDAVWVMNTEPYFGNQWQPLVYPPQHPRAGQSIDLAFRLNTASEGNYEVKWSQPPTLHVPVDGFNGWNEYSVFGATNIVADDWACTNRTPVTDVHWWGSFIGWMETNPPALPDGFVLSIWGDVPAGPVGGGGSSHPGTNLWQILCTNFTWKFAGWDFDPRNPALLPEACYKFEQDLLPNEWFYQHPADGTNIYWLSISAWYAAGQMPAFPWGWKTRPRDPNSLAPDDAVDILSPTYTQPGSVYGLGHPLYWPYFTNSWDMAFALTTRTPLDFGDAPDPTFPTWLTNNGARHVIVNGVQLGLNLDAETDGQPNVLATGDDINGGLNDEDGVAFVGNLIPAQAYNFQLFASVAGFLNAWVDFNGDGSWAQAGDQVCTNLLLSAGNNTVTIQVPTTATWGVTAFARFRFTTAANSLGYVGQAADGEVEDYALRVEPMPQHDLGDAPASLNNSFPAPGLPMTAYPLGGPAGVIANFPTAVVMPGPMLPVGPIHMLPTAVAFLGNNVTFESNADIGPDTDFINNILPARNQPDNDGADDGVVFPLTLPHCRPTQFNYNVTFPGPPPVPPGTPLFVNVWFDWNRDGDWNDVMKCPDGSSAPEHAVVNQLIPVAVPPPPYPIVMNMASLPFRAWHPTTTNQPIWMRITLAEQAWPGGGSGVAGGDGPINGYLYGETEDYYLTTYDYGGELDFGDAPSPYPTLLAADGARHYLIPGFGLGALQDSEADGLPDPLARGDDNNGSADEDGVLWPANLLVATQNCVNVVLTSGAAGGQLDAWLDFNRSGSWEAGEQIITNCTLVPGTNSGLCFLVPATAKLGTNFARFRLSSVGNLSVSGVAQDGEVEDYAVLLRQRRPATNIVITHIGVTNITTNQVITIQWNAETNVHYQLVATGPLTNAPPLSWTNVGPVILGPANSLIETNVAQFQRYYRVTAPYVAP